MKIYQKPSFKIYNNRWLCWYEADMVLMFYKESVKRI